MMGLLIGIQGCIEIDYWLKSTKSPESPSVEQIRAMRDRQHCYFTVVFEEGLLSKTDIHLQNLQPFERKVSSQTLSLFSGLYNTTVSAGKRNVIGKLRQRSYFRAYTNKAGIRNESEIPQAEGGKVCLRKAKLSLRPVRYMVYQPLISYWRYPMSKGKGEAPARQQEGRNHFQNQTPYPPGMLRGLKHTLCGL